MAMALFSDLANQNSEKPDQWRIESSGCWAVAGMPATQTAITAMNARGLNLENHRSRSITESLLDQFKLILCMEFDHKISLQRNFPFCRQRIFLLSEMVNKDTEIQDPVGLPLEIYQKTADEMLDILQKGFEKIKRLSL